MIEGSSLESDLAKIVQYITAWQLKKMSRNATLTRLKIIQKTHVLLQKQDELLHEYA